jgi:PST family polysaccharide transporter
MQQDMPKKVELATSKKHTYDQILKSSALIGGSQAITIAIRIVRIKAMAVLLGPAGVGLMGVYESIANLAQSIAGMGINSSGVRQIAEAVGTGEKDRIARTVTMLRRTAILLGILGTLLLVVFSRQISTLTFGNDQHTASVALLSLAVCFGLVSGGQGALILGMRRISDLARMGVLGTLFSTMISIPVVYILREDGVVPAIVGVAAMSIITSWWYSRKVQIQLPSLTVSQVKEEAAGLLKLGFVFMASALMAMGAAYAVRIIVIRQAGFEGAGFYQSGWAVGGMYVGFILQAMGADFLPRLTAVAKNNAECNRLANEQAHVGLLLAGPGVIATLTVAPMLVALFYSAKFGPAGGILRWMCLGMALRLISWPMSFIIVAKSEKSLFFCTDLAWAIVNVGLSWICVRSFGLDGAGIAFFGSYVFHGLIIYPIVRRLSGFGWSAANVRTGLLFLSSIAVVFCGFYVLPPLLATGVGALVVILSGVYSIRVLLNLISPERIPLPIRFMLVWLRIAPHAIV